MKTPARHRDLRRRIDQFVANPTCDANVGSVVLDVPMRTVAARELPPDHSALREGQSPFALARGVTFERALYDNPDRLLSDLVRLGVLPAAHAGTLDLRLRAHGGPMPDLDASAAAFEKVLRTCARASTLTDTDALSVLIVGPTMKLPGAPLLPYGVFAADLVAVRFDPSLTARTPFTLRVGEVKVYPDRGGHTDGAQLAGARAQAGMYVHALRQTLAALGLGDAVTVDDNGFLVLAHASSNAPVVHWPEDLKWQARRARDGWRRLADTATTLTRDGTPSDPVEAVRSAATDFHEGCTSFCARAPACRKRAETAGDPKVLGPEVAAILGDVTLLRAEALLRGRAVPESDSERDLMRRVGAVDDVRKAVS